jgi:four helix bundle protein
MATQPVKTFEDLDAWKACRTFRQFATRLAQSLPSDEKYRLTDQLIRSSRSITANIAEGYGRYHYQENLQFCRQGRGSLYESLDHAIAGNDDGLISASALAHFRQLFDKAVVLLNGYINYLDKAARKTRKGAGKVNSEL